MTYNSIFLDSLNSIDKSWSDFLTSDIIQEIKTIENSIRSSENNFTPVSPFVLRFLETSLLSVKVIILGQDQIGRAHV